MSYSIQLSDSAKAEITKAKQWYEEQSPGLGNDFASTIKEHINTLQDERIEHKPAFDDVRRILVKRFPYVIYYTRYPSKQLILIVAVLHNRQLPLTS